MQLRQRYISMWRLMVTVCACVCVCVCVCVCEAPLQNAAHCNVEDIYAAYKYRHVTAASEVCKAHLSECGMHTWRHDCYGVTYSRGYTAYVMTHTCGDMTVTL